MAAREPDAPDLPTLAYVFRPRSFDTLALSAAARGRCSLLWVLDTSIPGAAESERLLARLGGIVDVTERSPREAAAAIADRAPDGILSLADEALRWTAEVAALLGLPFHSPACATRLTDKAAQRAALREGGLVVPRSWTLVAVPDPEQLAAIEHEVTLPAVLKPQTGEGSRDTFPVGSIAELHEALATSAAGGPMRALVLEEYIPDAVAPLGGEGFAGYLSVESVVAGGQICHLATNGRMPPAYPFRETGFFIPSALDGGAVDAVLDVATAAIASLGVTIGCLHTEIKLTDDGPVVIEVNGRIGGGVPEMLERACGEDLLALAMDVALGAEPACTGLLPISRLSFLFYVHAGNEVGLVTAIDGVAEVRAAAGVEEVVLRRVPGDAVDWREGNHGHVLSVLGTADDHDGLRRTASLIESAIRIEVAAT